MSRTVKCEMPDLSVHNGAVNIKQIRDAGYLMVGLRAGYGKNNVDQRYITNAEACYNLDVSPLIYWFSYALSADMAAKEAEYAVAQAAKYWISCPIAYDLEYDTVRYARTKGVSIDKQLATDMAIAFLQVVRSAGYIPVIYTNEDYLKNYFDFTRITEAVGQVYVWYARYGLSSLPANRVDIADIWQYTSSGSIPGVSGKVDLNKVYANLYQVTQAVETTVAQQSYNINIQSFQAAANADGYRDESGKELEVDGKDGTNTQYVRRQINLQAKWRLLKVERSTGEVVKWVQMRLNEILGTDLQITGEYDSATVKAVKEFQRQYNLVVDGLAGYNTLQMLFYS